MATDHDDEARPMHWSTMEWKKDKSKLSLSHKVRSRGRMLDWSPPVGPTVNWALDPRPDRGRPTILLTDGPPSCSAIKRKGGGRDARYEVHCSRLFPTDVLTLDRSRWCAVSDGKRHRLRRHHWTAPPCRCLLYSEHCCGTVATTSVRRGTSPKFSI